MQWLPRRSLHPPWMSSSRDLHLALVPPVLVGAVLYPHQSLPRAPLVLVDVVLYPHQHPLRLLRSRAGAPPWLVRLSRLLHLFTSLVASATSMFVDLSSLLSSSRLLTLLDGSATSTLVIFMHHFQRDSSARLLECCRHFLRLSAPCAAHCRLPSQGA
jgi:hypothetical protein